MKNCNFPGLQCTLFGCQIIFLFVFHQKVIPKYFFYAEVVLSVHKEEKKPEKDRLVVSGCSTGIRIEKRCAKKFRRNPVSNVRVSLNAQEKASN